MRFWEIDRFQVWGNWEIPGNWELFLKNPGFQDNYNFPNIGENFGPDVEICNYPIKPCFFSSRFLGNCNYPGNPGKRYQLTPSLSGFDLFFIASLKVFGHSKFCSVDVELGLTVFFVTRQIYLD